MKNTYKPVAVTACTLVLLLLLILPASAAPKKLTIGMIFDTPISDAGIVSKLEKEIAAVLSGRRNVTIPKETVFRTSGEPEAILNAYRQLIETRDVDLIIGTGMLTATALGSRNSYPKPLILLGVFEPELQNIPHLDEGISGKRNLTYLINHTSFKASLISFKKIYPFQSIGIAAGAKVIESVRDFPEMQVIMDELGISHRFIPVESGMESFGIAEKEVDAVLVGGLHRVDDVTVGKLIAEVESLKLPSFTGDHRHVVEEGVLAGLIPKNIGTKVPRRIALMVEKIVGGQDPGTFPVTLSMDESLVVNMETAERIGFHPSWDIMSEAELINYDPFTSDNRIDLKGAVSMALSENLSVTAARDSLEIAEEGVNLARSAFRPVLEASLSDVQINDERAVGGQAENTAAGSLKVTQLIFSEPRLSDIDAGTYLWEGAAEDLRQEELDTILSVSNAYFNILMAKTNMMIQKESLSLTRKNLEIAHVRNKVGYAGMSDVYRWESLLATTTSEAIDAHVGVVKAQNNLRNLLNRPITENLDVVETTLSSAFFETYSDFRITDLIDNKRSFERFLDFLVDNAKDHHPEINSLNAGIAATQRSLASLKRKNVLPTVSLAGEWTETLADNGTGADFSPDPEDSNWSVALNASWSLYNGGSDRIKVRRTLKELSRLTKQRDQLAKNLETELRNAALDLLSKSEKLEFSRKAAGSGRKSLNLTQDAYARGSVSVVELLDAQNTAVNSDLAAANAVYEYLVSIMTLERKNGRYLSLLSPEKQRAFRSRLNSHLGQTE